MRIYPLQEDGSPFPTTAQVRKINDILAEQYHDAIMTSINGAREFRGLEPLVRPFVKEYR